MELTVAVYNETKKFPNSEMYGLTNQIRRAAVSIPSNIAEGYGRTNKEFARHLAIARGSLAELSTQFEIAKRIGYLSNVVYQNLDEEITILTKQLNALTSKVKSHPAK